MKRHTIAAFGAFAVALVMSGFGCELITAPDRSLIDAGGNGGQTTTTGGGGTGATGGGGTGGTTGGGGTGGSTGTPCETAGDCTPPNACVDATCVSGFCHFETKADGPQDQQIAGDCKVKQCTNGVPMEVTDDLDLPVPQTDCKVGVCTQGTPSEDNAPIDTACGAGGLLKCDGAGQCVDCFAAADCGVDDECKTFTCTAGVCDQVNTAQGTPLATQIDGDCQVEQCDGNGSTELVNDNADVPVDGTTCTNDVCVLGVPSNIPVQANTACSEGTGILCDGNGKCVECNVATDCPGVDDECGTRTCTAGVCGKIFAPLNTPALSQTAKDCKQNVCDGAGAIIPVNDDADLPDDNNPCTTDTCSSGNKVFTDVAQGVSCGAPLVCDGNGQCVGCNVAADCPGADDECKTRTCVANVCGLSFTAANTPVASQTANDCKKNVCDGSGNIVNQNDDADVPVDDGNQCTGESCISGVPAHPAKAANTACTQNGGSFCSAGGQCVQCNSAAQCAGSDTECQTRTCVANACGFTFQPNGFVTPTQVTGDCKVRQCDGAGNFVQANSNGDLPADDGNQCTDEVCNNGAPAHPAKAVDTACNQNGGSFCSAGGQCVQCNAATQCAGSDTACQTRTCNANTCGFNFQPNGTVIASQTPGDCKEDQCNGSGGIVTVNKDTDLPADDGNQCTDEICTAGVPSHPNKPADTTCNQNGGSFCSAGGLCVQCNAAAQCPGTDNACQTRTCNSNTCGFNFQPNGTVIASQTPGDCKEDQCNGTGTIVTVNKDTDVPADDGNQCTDEICTAGVPSHPNKPADTTCSQNGGTVCDAGGQCVQCNSGSQCPGTDNACQTRTCNSNTCGMSFQPNGFVIASQTPGDCKEDQCNGTGAVVTVNKDTDLPADDGNQCTSEVCNSGVPSHPNKPADTTCSQNGGTVCDAGGQCVQCNAAAQCPGTDNACQTRTCNSNTCGFLYQPNGFVIASQTSGDCKENQCNGTGTIVAVNKDTDLPADDGNQCTSEACNSGVPSHPNKPADTTCNQNGGTVCTAGGQCVQCNTATQCPGSDTACQTRTCSSNTCGVSNQPNGFVIASQTPGDCKENQCNGSGAILSVVKDTDLPVDGNQCTGDVCTSGVASNPDLPLGTSCSQNGGTQCNGSGVCVAASCSDNTKNGTESDIDCGGGACAPCGLGQTCNGNSDCASNACAGGVCVECVTAAQCPGVDTACQTRTCNSNTCGFSYQPNGFVIASQTPGDCLENQCNGTGAIVIVPKDTDLPADDGNQCTGEACNSGVASHPSKAADTACNQNGGAVCDGAGACVQCNAASQCAGSDTACQTRTCNSHTCGFSYQPNGFVIASQTPNDCLENQCNGSGSIVSIPKDTDLPLDDGNQCTGEACNSGVASHPPKPADTACNQNGGAVCDGASACVQCNSGTQCSGSDTACQTRTCNSHTCGFSYQPPGTVIASQTSGDCQQNQCDGAGAIVSVAFNSDVPADDGFECTSETCVAGVPAHPNKAADTPCSQGGGSVCNGAGACVQCNNAGQCGTATECKSFSCSVAGACSQNNTAAGFVTSSQTSGDCKENQCDGNGNITAAVKDTDLPVDGNQCTNDVCTNGIATNPASPFGTSCSQNGGNECNGVGACVLTPAVQSTVPDNGATAVALGSTIQITFNQAMSAGTLTAQTTAGSCTGSIQVSSNDFKDCIAFTASAPVMSGSNSIATLTPALPARLYAGTNYRIRVTTAAQAPGNIPLGAQFTQASGFTTVSGAAVCDGNLVISQIFGGGGLTGAPYKNDFVELHNRGTTPVSLNGLSLQYTASNGTAWNSNKISLPNVSLAAGGYFLVKMGNTGGTIGANLPAEDLIWNFDMSANNGKMALVTGTTGLAATSCPDPTRTLDFVGFGTADCREGTAAAPAAGNTQADLRGENGCADTNANNNNFAAGAANPRNTASPVSLCTCNSAANETNTANEADYCVLQFPTAPFTVPPTTTVYGRIYEAGTTDNSTVATSNIIAQFGYGPNGSDPRNNSAWYWYGASFNVNAGNNDEYQYTVTSAAAGTYSVGYRFSFDGLQWTYCDLDKTAGGGDAGSGSNAGLTFSPSDLTTMTAN